jgi:hypothetical protein
VISELLIGKDLEGNGRGLIKEISRYSPGGTGGKHEKISVKIAGLCGEISTRDLPSVNHDVR